VRHLLSSAAANLARGDDAALALTGPVVRGDTGTVRRHLEAIAAADEDVRAAYLALSEASLTVARAAGTDDVALAAIARLLEAADSRGADGGVRAAVAPAAES
jgi:predicted short-subunit dehydrogenase-like oxidoreductase (DUF2520 family)